MTPSATQVRSEIISGPLALELAGALSAKSPSEALRILNAPVRDGYRSITVAEAMRWAAGGPRAAMEDVSVTQGHPCRASVLVILDLFKGGSSQTIHLGDSTIRSVFAGWKAAGLITDEQHATLLNTASTKISRITELEWENVTEDLVGGCGLF